MQKALRLEPWPTLNPLTSLNNSAGVLSVAFHLSEAQLLEQGCWVHLRSPVLEEKRVVEARGAGSMLQTLIHLTSGDQVPALHPAPSLPCLGMQRACRIIVCNLK